MKNEKTNPGFMISTVAFCLAVVVALPIRVWQFFTNLEPGAGFYINSASIDIYVLYFFLGAGLVISLLSALVYKKELGFDRTVKKRPGQGILSLLSAFSILYSAAIDLNYILSLNPLFIQTDEQFRNARTVITCMRACFGVLAAIYFVVLGVTLLMGKTNGSEYKILSVTPMAWFMLRIVSRFMTTISFIKVSELTLELFMLVFMLMFFGAFAQLNSKIESKGLDWKLIGYGLPAAALGLVCFVPRLVMMITGHPDFLYENEPLEYCDLFLALFALTVIFSRVGWVGGNVDVKEEKEAEEAKKAAEAEKAEETEKAEEAEKPAEAAGDK